jgi:hypothetical protein
MPDLYETYIRTRDDQTYHPEDIRKGLADFLGPNGYRISFNIDGVVITLRRDTPIDREIMFLDEQLRQDTLECAVTIRGHR